MLANRINRVRIKNYRSLADVDMTFEDLTVLVGPNGSGKSNVVDALRFVRDALTMELGDALNGNYRNGLENLLRYEAIDYIREFSVILDLTVNGQAADYSFIISMGEESRNDFFVKEESCSIGNNQFRRVTGTVTSISEEWSVNSNRNRLVVPVKELALNNLEVWIDSPDLTAILQLLVTGGFYAMTPDIFRPPQPQSWKLHPLDEHGRNLASVLNDFIVSKNQWLPDLNESLSLVVPELKSEDTITTQDLGGYLIVQLHHRDGSQFVLAHESDGTLRVLGILTALYQNPPLPLTVIEEPELGIHPHAIGVLADVLVEASNRTQLLLTTHSPDLISRFQPESLRLVERDPQDGTTKIGKIMPANLASVEEKLFSSGDLLRIGALRRDR